jgi:hypothetical protein
MRMRDAGRDAQAFLQLRAFSYKVQAMVYGGHLAESDASALFAMYVTAVTSLG